MSKKILIGFLVFLLVSNSGITWTFQQQNPNLDRANHLYFLDNPSESQDLEAIALYQDVLAAVPNPSEAADFVLASERLGNLFLTYGKVKDAKNAYNQGIVMARAFQLPDTLVYAHHLYLGEALFALNQLDSSLYHLQKAEMLQTRIQENAEPERLYNALGVYFFETGNFNQSVSYFSKAESYLLGENPDMERYARYSFSSNKASALYKLEKFDSAQTIYKGLLKLGINTDQIRINLANTYIEERNPERALEVLDSIQPDFANNSLSFRNLRSKVFLQKQDLQNLEKELSLAKVLVEKDSLSSKNLQKGIYYSLLGDFWIARQKEEEALKYFQLSIAQLHPEFQNPDPFSNPDQMALGMSALTLFDVLTKKAQTAWTLYDKTKKDTWFALGLDTWKKAFSLARFISVNYDNDEARVFLGDKVQLAYQKAMDSLFRFFAIKKDDFLMELAFVWSEESKSEGLNIGAKEEARKRSFGLPGELIQEEKNLLFSISKNYQKLLDTQDGQVRAQLEKDLVDLRVNLSRIREKFRQYPGFIGEEDSEFTLAQLQQNLPQGYGVMTFFISESNLFLFWVENQVLDWKVVPLSEIPMEGLRNWMTEIQSPQSGQRLSSNPDWTNFSELVLGSFQDRLVGLEELILVPHQLFNKFPFDLLSDSSGNYLIETLPISYQFSARFIKKVSRESPQPAILAVAPFIQEGPENLRGFTPLRQSVAEISALEGEKLMGKEATREVFLERSPKAKIIHLATHAVASSEDPNEAFIAFYPGEEEFRVFAPELAFQNLDPVELVYLSACETGSGKVSNSEGLISLARSLAIAGVDQLVISQWVSEDQVSAYLSSRFYEYAGMGESYSNALRKAKLDLLDDPTMAQFHHPYYWTNYRIIGQPEVGTWRFDAILWILGIFSFLAVGVWAWTRKDLQA